MKLSDTEPKPSLHPVWGFQTHFKVENITLESKCLAGLISYFVRLQVYPASESDFQFISGVKKHQQYSLEGIKGDNIVDNLEDISQVRHGSI